jgi:hypothetical protein
MVLQNATKRCFIAEESDACQPRNYLLKQFELLLRLLRIKGGDACDIAARTFRIDPQCTHRIGGGEQNYWNRRRRTYRGPTNYRSNSDDNVHFAPDKFGGESGELIVPSRRPARFDSEVPAIDIAEVGKTLTKCLQCRIGCGLRWSRAGREEPDRHRRLGKGRCGNRSGKKYREHDDPKPHSAHPLSIRVPRRWNKISYDVHPSGGIRTEEEVAERAPQQIGDPPSREMVRSVVN